MAATPFTIERTRMIAASAATIQPHLVDFHRWRDWSPWEGLDDDLQRTYGGPEEGVGATYAWSGNRQAGRGSMEITDVADGRVGVDLHFEMPFKAHSKITFVLVPEGAATRVTWRMDGENAGLAKVFSKLINMDKLVGKDFDKGLAQLDDVVTTG